MWNKVIAGLMTILFWTVLIGVPAKVGMLVMPETTGLMAWINGLVAIAGGCVVLYILGFVTAVVYNLWLDWLKGD